MENYTLEHGKEASNENKPTITTSYKHPYLLATSKRDAGPPHGHLHCMIKKCYYNNLGRRRADVIMVIIGFRFLQLAHRM
jgi:hypothetical protein